MNNELFEILSKAKERYWKDIYLLDRTKSIYYVEARNLKNNNWHDITMFIKSITVNHNDDGHSTCELTLNNRHFELTGKGLITENFGVRIFLGYRDTGLIFQGEFVIDTPTPEFPDGSFPVITLSGKDMLIEASDNEEVKVYSSNNDEAIKSISKDHDWEYENDDGYYDKDGEWYRNGDDYYWDEDRNEHYYGEKSGKQKSGTNDGSRIRSGISE